MKSAEAGIRGKSLDTGLVLVLAQITWYHDIMMTSVPVVAEGCESSLLFSQLISMVIGVVIGVRLFHYTVTIWDLGWPRYLRVIAIVGLIILGLASGFGVGYALSLIMVPGVCR